MIPSVIQQRLREQSQPRPINSLNSAAGPSKPAPGTGAYDQEISMYSQMQPAQKPRPQPFASGAYDASRRSMGQMQSAARGRGGFNQASTLDLARSARDGFRGGRRMGAKPARPDYIRQRMGRGGSTPYANGEDYRRRNMEMRNARQSYFTDRFRKMGGGGGQLNPGYAGGAGGYGATPFQHQYTMPITQYSWGY